MEPIDVRGQKVWPLIKSEQLNDNEYYNLIEDLNKILQVNLGLRKFVILGTQTEQTTSVLWAHVHVLVGVTKKQPRNFFIKGQQEDFKDWARNEEDMLTDEFKNNYANIGKDDEPKFNLPSLKRKRNNSNLRTRSGRPYGRTYLGGSKKSKKSRKLKKSKKLKKNRK